MYDSDKLDWLNETFLPHLEAMTVGIIPWENLLDHMESHGAGQEYRQFYNTCCEYHNL